MINRMWIRTHHASTLGSLWRAATSTHLPAIGGTHQRSECRADTQSQIITLIKMLRIKRSLIKDPMTLWGCQFSGLALLLGRWWVSKQNQRSLNYKDESQSQKRMRKSVLCDGDGPAPISHKPCSAWRESHALKLNAPVNIPANLKDWINSSANVSQVVANSKSSYDLVIYVHI